jgi:hypothetical protein
MRVLTKYFLFLWLLMPAALLAQRIPPASILLFHCSKNTEGVWQAAAPQYLTAFNQNGYNNQPKFFADNELWLTVQTPDDTTQTEIYALDLLLKKVSRVTATPLTAEYSPTPMPGGKRFSAVRVEEDGNQRLWSFPLDRSDNGRPEFPRLLNVGYHCWLRDTMVAFFIVGENGAPHTLQVAGTRAQKPVRIASNIGRCLAHTADNKLAFVQKPTEQTWFIKTWDPVTKTQEIVIKTLNGAEDFALMPDGTYLMGEGSRLYFFKPGRDEDWRQMADFSKYGVKKISRLAAGKDGKLAVVVE